MSLTVQPCSEPMFQMEWERQTTQPCEWRMWYLDTEQIIAMKGNVSASWIEANMPQEGWPPGDGSENYSYNAVAPPVPPEDDGEVPALVAQGAADRAGRLRS